PAERTASLRGQVRGYLPGRFGYPQVLHAGRPHPARLGFGAGTEQALPRRFRTFLRDAGIPAAPGAVVAASAADGGEIVEFPAQVLHPAAVRRQVAEHRLLLARPLRGDALVAFGVVGPRLAGRLPASRDTADRAVHVEHLEHGFQSPAGQVD